MFIRVTSLLAALLVTAALAAAALATDSPPPDQLAPAPPINSVQSVLNKCKDNTRPKSAFTKKDALKATRTGTLRGTASDRGCGVALVTISVAHRQGKHCRFLTTTGRLGKARTCLGDRWLTAAGTKHWRVGLDRLKRGTYRVRVRAIDFAGNVQQLPHARRLKLR
jgi:hypothetical protein